MTPDERMAEMEEDIWENYDPFYEEELDRGHRLLWEPTLSDYERNK